MAGFTEGPNKPSTSMMEESSLNGGAIMDFSKRNLLYILRWRLDCTDSRVSKH
jgi:hypothetical protein